MRLASIDAIDRETDHALTKHSQDSIRTQSLERAGCILGEEAGEVQKAILDATRNGKTPSREELMEIYEEAVDTASVAIRIMERLEIELS